MTFRTSVSFQDATNLKSCNCALQNLTKRIKYECHVEMTENDFLHFIIFPTFCT